MMNSFFLCRSSLANQSPGGGPPAAWQGPDLKISKTEFRNTFRRSMFQWFGKLQNECCTTQVTNGGHGLKQVGGLPGQAPVNNSNRIGIERRLDVHHSLNCFQGDVRAALGG